MKKTLQEKLWERKISKPGLIYLLLGYLTRRMFYKKYNVKVNFDCDIKTTKEKFVLIGNHASREDWVFICMPLLPKKINFVCGYNEFFRSHLKFVLRAGKAIPKMNFTIDTYAIKEILRVNKQNRNIAIMLEGMSSISGHNQPIAKGSSKLVKKLNSNVYYAVIEGAYLTSPKYNLNERKGEVTVTFKKFLDKEELYKYSDVELEELINKTIYHDDYEYNLNKKIYYESNDIAKNLEYLLYKCPKCGNEFTNFTTNNTIECSSCLNKVILDNYYNLIPSEGSKSKKTPSEWFDYERNEIKKLLESDKNYSYSEEVKIGILPKYKYLKNKETSEIVGEGTLTISKDGLFFNGIKENKEFNFHLEINEVPTYGMCTDCSRFYIFYKGEFIEFYPSKKSTIKFLLLTEELYNLYK